MVETLAGWARWTCWSGFPEPRATGFAETEWSDRPGEAIYRLRLWPSLPSAQRTADVFRLLSLMSIRPLNRSWMLKHSRLGAQRIDHLLQQLIEQEALQVIDPSQFPAQVAGQP